LLTSDPINKNVGLEIGQKMMHGDFVA